VIDRGGPGLIAGIGFRPGTSLPQLQAALASALGKLTLECRVVATIDTRQAEPSIRRLADELGAELLGFSAELLARQPVPNPSARVGQAVATGSVAEAAVLAAGAEIVRAKTILGPVTVALGRLP
jgi:cobalamin biosynthesis protein CbiG